MKKNSTFNPSKAAEKEYSRALRKIAKISSHIVEAHVEGSTLKNTRAMMKALEEYSRLIGPWALRQSIKMITQVSNSNKRAYANKSKLLSKGLKYQLAETKVGLTATELMNENVKLIKSIPREAGLRAQKLALEATTKGTRADEIAAELKKTYDVTESRAMLIARTEVARANASINQARAVSLGSSYYHWHNSGDAAVRPSHKKFEGEKLQGRIFPWDNPPTLDDGMTGHPGTFPNCRCFAEAIFDD